MSLDRELKRAMQRLQNGEHGPLELKGGPWNKSQFDAWASTYEGHWRISWRGDSHGHGAILVYGDRSLPHEIMSGALTIAITRGVMEYLASGDKSGEPAYDALTPKDKFDCLIEDSHATLSQWQIGDGHSAVIIAKEPDGLFRPFYGKFPHDGVVIEVAYSNESFIDLHRELQEWTDGSGDRATLSVGLRIHKFENDPYLTLFVVKSPSDVVTYPFGRGSSVHHGPVYDKSFATVSTITSARIADAGNPDPEALPELKVRHEDTVELPIGHALFDHAPFQQMQGFTQEYLNYLRNMVVMLDLPKLRRQCVGTCIRQS